MRRVFAPRRAAIFVPPNDALRFAAVDALAVTVRQRRRDRLDVPAQCGRQRGRLPRARGAGGVLMDASVRLMKAPPRGG
jgi:hypothetical protein